jgi:nitric oxide reductase large subunit
MKNGGDLSGGWRDHVGVYRIHRHGCLDFLQLPPIPQQVVTKSGQLLFTAQDVIEGKVLAQKYGFLDYGSFLGFGGYFGIDYTAYTMKFYVDQDQGAQRLLLVRRRR